MTDGRTDGAQPTEPYPQGLGVEHPTVPLPRENLSSAPRRRRRWPWIVGGALVLVVALLVGGEFAARAVVAAQVRTHVLAALKLPADQQLDVRTEGVVLPQLLAGRLDALHLSSDSVSFGGVTGAAEVDATGVPISGGALGGATGRLRMDAAQLGALLKTTSLPIDAVALDGGALTATGAVSVLGAKVPFSATLTPGAAGGDLTLTPGAVSVGGLTIDPSDTSSPLGGVLKDFVGTQRICIADRIPAGVQLTGLAVEGGSLVASFSVDGRISVDPALQAHGTCPRS